MGNSSITTYDAATIGSKIVDVVKSFAMPIGSALIFVAVVVIAIQLIIAHNNPQKRADTMGSLPYLAIGSLLLGGALVVAGFIVNLGLKF